jgi:hypothetical protein
MELIGEVLAVVEVGVQGLDLDVLDGLMILYG